MTAIAPPTHELDLFADEVLLDPYPAYAGLRELGGVVHLPANDVYALTRYDVIRDALADWESFSSVSIGFNPMVNEALTGTSLASDPPVHTQLRAVLAENLSPRALRGLKDEIDAKADALVAELVQQGSFEAIDALARAFPLQVVADLIGFTGQVRDNMLRWGQAAMEVIGPMNARTRENFPIAGELYGWCSTVTADDLAPGSVGRGIFDAEARGDIPPDTAGHIIHQYLGAGVDTTVAAIGNVVALLGAHPDQLALVREDPSLVPADVQRGAPLLGTDPRLGSSRHEGRRGRRCRHPGRFAGRDPVRGGKPGPASLREPRRLPGRAQPDRPPHVRLRPPRLRGTGTRPPGGPRRDRGAVPPRRATRRRRRGPRPEQHHPEHPRAPRPGGGAGMKRIVLDRARCEGHGLCEEAAPQLMHLDDDGELVLDREEITEAELPLANAAVRVCPVAALRIE